MFRTPFPDVVLRFPSVPRNQIHPYGEILTKQDIVESLKNGKFVAQNEKAFSILSFLFVEIDPSLLVKCMNELQLPLKNLKSLYYYALELGHLSNSEWENYIKDNL